MGFLHTLKAWLRTEAADLAESAKQMEERLDADLSKRERQLNETPEEAMKRLQSEIDDSESSFDAISDKIGHAAAKADAVADLVDSDDDGAVSEDSEAEG